METASLLRASLLLLPPFSVVVAMATRCLCRATARKLSALARSQFACLPSGGPSFRYLVSSPSPVEDIKGGGGGGQLPVAVYSRRTTRRRSVVVGEEREEEHEEEECVLCLSGIEEGSEVRELRCRHLFHRGCLDRWVRARPVAATCPLCRGRLLLASPPPWEVAGYCGYDYDDEEEEVVEEDSDMTLFMACVHSSSSSWLWRSRES